MNEQSTLKRTDLHDKHTLERADAIEAGLGDGSMVAPVTLDAAAGAAAGAVAGTIAGPAGIAIGAVIGGIVGAAAGIVVESSDQEKREHDAELDQAIGVSGGNLGEASPDQPPSRGRFHAAALGVSDVGPQSSDGPIQNVDGARS